MLGGIRRRLTFANVMSTIAVFCALGGGAYAAATLPKNSVGTKQLKKNAVTNGKLGKNAVTNDKLANDAVTGAKVKDGSLTGADINLATLPKVGTAAIADNAAHATNADNATKAANADHATNADNIAPPESSHEIGAAGEPGFEGGTTNYGAVSPGTNTETAGFYKDKQGIVHLKGLVKTANSGTNVGFLFYLPAGYRPGSKKLLILNAFCTTYSGGTGTCSGAGIQQLWIIGAGTDIGGGTVATDGLVYANSGVAVSLDGITFRAEG
jgi:hypothetical protein